MPPSRARAGLDPPLQKGEAVELPGLVEDLQGNTINAACIDQNALSLAPIGRGGKQTYDY